MPLGYKPSPQLLEELERRREDADTRGLESLAIMRDPKGIHPWDKRSLHAQIASAEFAYAERIERQIERLKGS